MIRIYKILRRLKEAKIHFVLSSYRDDTIMITVSVPGHRWEVEVFEDGSLETEVFSSDGSIIDYKATSNLIKQFTDD